MKRYITIIALAVLPFTMSAQQNNMQWNPGNAPRGQWDPGAHQPRFGGGQQQFSPEAFKQRLEQFVTQHAGLTQQESQQFFPLLHEMLSKQRQIQNNINANLRKGNEAKSESDFERLLKQNAQLEIENNRIELSYYQKFHKILTWEKIYKVKGALYLFNMEALRKFAPTPNPQHRIGQWPAVPQQQKK